MLNAADRGVPPLGDFCRGLAHELGLPSVQTNLYLTPPNAQGFAAHYDRHCVLVLQVHGEKRWRLYGMGAELPVDRADKLFPRVTDPGRVEQEFVMKAGDLLYIPRGLIHEAVTSEAASLHITLGLHPCFAFDLIAQLREKARRIPALRRGLVFGPATEAARRETQSVLQAWLAAVDVTDLPEQMRALRDAQVFPGAEHRFSDLVQVPELTAESLLSRRPDVGVTVRREGDA